MFQGQGEDSQLHNLLFWKMTEDLRQLTQFKFEERVADPYRDAYLPEEAVYGASEGKYYDEKLQVCQTRQCRCGTDPGVSGRDCKQHGTQHCRHDQIGKCESLDCSQNANLVTWQGNYGTNCTDHKCESTPDLKKCCMDWRASKTFKLRVYTADCWDCGTDSDVYVTLKGKMYHAEEGKKVEKEIEITRLLDDYMALDFNRGAFTDYTITLWQLFVPTQICFHITTNALGVTNALQIDWVELGAQPQEQSPFPQRLASWPVLTMFGVLTCKDMHYAENELPKWEYKKR